MSGREPDFKDHFSGHAGDFAAQAYHWFDREAFTEAWGDPDETKAVRWPLVLRACCKP